MKKSNLILLITLALVMSMILLGAIIVRVKFIGPGIEGDGNIVTQQRTLESFDKIRVSDHFTVVFTQDNIQSVIVSADANLIDLVLTRVDNDVLIIESIERLRSRKELKLEISNNDLTEVITSRSAKFITQNQLNLSSLKLTGNAGSFMDIDGIIESLRVSQNAGSRLFLKGEGTELDVEANAGAQVKAIGFEANKANVTANAGSQVEVNAKELSIHATSGSNVTYLGTPIISNINLNSGATAKSR